MKVITEAIIRAELKATKPEVYYIPEGKLLSPAAREYLNQMQVDIDFERNRGAREAAAPKPAAVAAPKPAPTASASASAPAPAEGIKAKYVDYETGAGYVEKPELMTQLVGNKLVDKNHPRIKYRGRLDLVQSDLIYARCVVDKERRSESL